MSHRPISASRITESSSYDLLFCWRSFSRRLRGHSTRSEVVMFRIIAVLIAASFVIPCTPARAQTPLRVGIVGLVHGHVHGFLQQSLHSSEISIVAVVEPNKELLAQNAKRYGFAPNLLFSDLEEMLGK